MESTCGSNGGTICSSPKLKSYWANDLKRKSVQTMPTFPYKGIDKKYLAGYAETTHACSHPPGKVSLCVTVGVRLHVRTCEATVVPDLENDWTDRAQTWYINGDQLVRWHAKVNWDLCTLHVRTCRVTVTDLENGWTDCAQIWYTVRDRLVGCRAQVSCRYPAAISHVQGPLSCSLRWYPKGVILVLLLTHYYLL